MKSNLTHVALDAHKKQHHVALADPRTGELRTFTVMNTARDVAKMVKRIKKEASGEVHFCYEAGVCGFGLRHWTYEMRRPSSGRSIFLLALVQPCWANPRISD